MKILDEPIFLALIAFIVALFGPSLSTSVPDVVTDFAGTSIGRFTFGMAIVGLTFINIRIAFIGMALLMVIYLTSSNCKVARMGKKE